MSYNKVANFDNLVDLFKAGSLKDLEPQLELYLQIKPNNLDALNLLGLLEKKKGNVNKALQIFEDLHKKHPNAPGILGNLGNLNHMRGNSLLAISRLNRALSLETEPHIVENILLTLGLAQKAVGQKVDALKTFQRGFLISGSSKDEFQVEIADLHRINEHYYEAAKKFEGVDIGLSKTHQLECIYRTEDSALFTAKAYKLLHEKKSNPLLGALISHANITQNTLFENPFCSNPLDYLFKGKIPLKKLTQELTAELVNFSRCDAGNSSHQDLLINGRQSNGNLLESGEKYIPKVKKIITACVNHYRRKFDDKAEPFLKNWPKHYKIYAWLINIKPNGYLQPHMHKKGWLSGSIYLHTPSSCTGSDGGISFGLHGAELPLSGKKFPETTLSVRTGEVVMFPSSLFHRTIPFKGTENRVSLAFDVIPVATSDHK